MKNIILFLLMVLSLIGCSRNKEEIKNEVNIDSNVMMYFKDYRTGICFSLYTHSNTIFPDRITYVPCTIEVEKMLINK